jgi:hypothetical protein
VFTSEKPLPRAFAGLSLNSTGRLSGIPSRPYNPSRKTSNSKRTKFTLLVADQTEATITRKFRFKIVEPLDITTQALADGVVSNAYRAKLKAIRGDKPYTWTNTVELPPGLTLDSTGEITGMPTTNGLFTNIVFRVTDPLGGSKQKAFSLSIGESRR